MKELTSGILFLVLVLSLSVESHIVERKQEKNDFVKKVHIIFMNHLDVGFADFAGKIINRYFVDFFPRALVLHKNLTTRGYVETFSYTTHPWLVSLYLECPPNLVLNRVLVKCPSEKEKTAFIQAIHSGIITWHAGPMNLQVEISPDWLFSAGLELSAELDRKFGIKRSTRVLSQRDVPGMTEAVLPLLIKSGITGVTVGVNGATPPPLLPSLFVWKRGQYSVLANWHPAGYPNNPGPYPSEPGGLSRHDCTTFEGFPEALCFAFRTDNSGPPVDVEEVLNDYEILRSQFPSAELKASRMEDFFASVESIRDKLPVYVGEIGDTWIQGQSSDPRKLAEFRTIARIMGDCVAKGLKIFRYKASYQSIEINRVQIQSPIARVMGDCVDKGKCVYSDKRFWNATRILLKIPEHTLGLDSPYDTIHWSNEQFYKLRTVSKNFINNADAWIEQRRFLSLVVEALEDHPIVLDINKELKNMIASKPDLTNYEKVSDHGKVFHCPHGNIKSLKFGPDGSIHTLDYNSIDWSDSVHSLGSFLYTTYNETDFKAFAKFYDYTTGWRTGFYKDNITINAHPESKVWPFQVTGLYSSKVAECDFYVSVAASDPKAVSYYGAPKILWYHYSVRQASTPGIDLTLQWFDKTITRLPESLTLSFKVKPQPAYKWWMSKMNTMKVDPQNVTLNGSQYQHGLDNNGAEYVSQSGSGIRVRSLDVPVACPIVAGDMPHIFPAPLTTITKPIDGMGFNIYNNLWDVNFIFWYPYIPGDEDFKMRFNVDFITGASAVDMEADGDFRAGSSIRDFLQEERKLKYRKGWDLI